MICADHIRLARIIGVGAVCPAEVLVTDPGLEFRIVENGRLPFRRVVFSYGGYMVAPRWLRGGFAVAARGVRGGYVEAPWWLRAVAADRLQPPHAAQPVGEEQHVDAAPVERERAIVDRHLGLETLGDPRRAHESYEPVTECNGM